MGDAGGSTPGKPRRTWSPIACWTTSHGPLRATAATTQISSGEATSTSRRSSQSAAGKAGTFKRLLDHVKSKVNIDAKRVYVIGFSMGGQGAWHVASTSDPGSKIAAMIPIGAWGCDEVERGDTPETCLTTKTPVWVQHCPFDEVSKITEQITLLQNHLDCGGYGRFTMIPGKGHIDRPRGADSKYFDLRMEWMLSQSLDTPDNYLVQVDGGTILEFVEGERGFIGDTARHGFFEPRTVIRITAPETRDGKKFRKWASSKGRFADPKARTAVYTTASGDTPTHAHLRHRPRETHRRRRHCQTRRTTTRRHSDRRHGYRFLSVLGHRPADRHSPSLPAVVHFHDALARRDFHRKVEHGGIS